MSTTNSIQRHSIAGKINFVLPNYVFIYIQFFCHSICYRRSNVNVRTRGKEISYTFDLSVPNTVRREQPYNFSDRKYSISLTLSILLCTEIPKDFNTFSKFASVFYSVPSTNMLCGSLCITVAIICVHQHFSVCIFCLSFVRISISVIQTSWIFFSFSTCYNSLKQKCTDFSILSLQTPYMLRWPQISWI